MRPLATRLALLSCAVVAVTVVAASVDPRPAAQAMTLPAGGAPLDPAVVSALLSVASEPALTPARQRARDRLFHEVLPRIVADGLSPTDDDAAAMLPALAAMPCAAGPLRVADAQVLGEAARVSVAGASGGCAALLRRQDDGWSLVMMLGWTLHE